MHNSYLNEVDTLLKESRVFVTEQETLLKSKEEVKQKLENINIEIQEKAQQLDEMIRAAAILGTVADEHTQFFLRRITDTINDALGGIFKDDKRRVYITQIMYHNSHPHFILELETEDGIKRSFKQSGTGLGQIVSFLFTVCLILARKGRKIIVMDELLNGLHPDAKEIIKYVIYTMQEKNNVQFVIVEYGMDIGKQYQVVKNSSIARVSEYENGTYYRDMFTEEEESVEESSMI